MTTFEKKFGIGTAMFRINDDKITCMLISSRMIFFENVSKENEKVFYSEGQKWETIVNALKQKYGFEHICSGIFEYTDNNLKRKKMTELLSFIEAYMLECIELDKNNSKYDYCGGDGLLITGKNFIDLVQKKQKEIERKMKKDMEDMLIPENLKRENISSILNEWL